LKQKAKSPQTGYAIVIKAFIGTHNCDTLSASLGDQYAIKRILV
jgi:hypothetical protein